MHLHKQQLKEKTLVTVSDGQPQTYSFPRSTLWQQVSRGTRPELRASEERRAEAVCDCACSWKSSWGNMPGSSWHSGEHLFRIMNRCGPPLCHQEGIDPASHSPLLPVGARTTCVLKIRRARGHWCVPPWTELSTQDHPSRLDLCSDYSDKVTEQTEDAFKRPERNYFCLQIKAWTWWTITHWCVHPRTKLWLYIFKALYITDNTFDFIYSVVYRCVHVNTQICVCRWILYFEI